MPKKSTRNKCENCECSFMSEAEKEEKRFGFVCYDCCEKTAIERGEECLQKCGYAEACDAHLW